MDRVNIDRTLYSTKPTDSNRLDKEMAAYELLDKLNIPYARVDHDAVATVEDCSEVESVLGIEICKNLFLRNGSKSEFYLHWRCFSTIFASVRKSTTDQWTTSCGFDTKRGERHFR